MAKSFIADGANYDRADAVTSANPLYTFALQD
jgi:hypothetical protein